MQFWHVDIGLEAPDFEGEIWAGALHSEPLPALFSKVKWSSEETFTVKDAAAGHPRRKTSPRFNGIFKKSGGLVSPRMF